MKSTTKVSSSTTYHIRDSSLVPLLDGYDTISFFRHHDDGNPQNGFFSLPLPCEASPCEASRCGHVSNSAHLQTASSSLKQIGAFQHFVDVEFSSERNRGKFIFDDRQPPKLVEEILEKSARVESVELLTTDGVHGVDAASVSPKAVVHGGERHAGPMRVQGGQHHVRRVQSVNVVRD